MTTNNSLLPHLLSEQIPWWNLYRRILKWRRRKNVGNFEKYKYPIIATHSTHSLAEMIVSVQPMNTPESSTFYFNYKYPSKLNWFERIKRFLKIKR